MRRLLNNDAFIGILFLAAGVGVLSFTASQDNRGKHLGPTLNECIQVCQDQKINYPPTAQGRFLSDCIHTCYESATSGPGSGATTDSQRLKDSNIIIDATYAYKGAHGVFPSTVNTTSTLCTDPPLEICKYQASPCQTNMNVLVDEGFLATIPFDTAAQSTGTGYFIRVINTGQLEVCDPNGTGGTISVVR